jgi:hypothetical protein
MPNHVFSVACQSAAVDQFTNTVSLQNVIERLDATTSEPVPISEPLQAIPFQFVIVSLWFNDSDTEGAVRQRVRVKAPDGKITSPGMETTLTVGPRASQRVLGRVLGILFRGNGVYWIEVDAHAKDRWETVARLPIAVEVKVTPPA